MRIASIGSLGLVVSRKFRRPPIKTVDTAANDLIAAGHLWSDHYLEMKHLDPKWMVALYVYAAALGKAFGWLPAPVSRIDRE